ncbi:Cys-tRNA(Pro) deacylase [Paenibacillus macquariensis]|uniref:Cys-tRNA(Pro)/Cys-tRNA(Cys) deacylase n=1 Tax=Paenibacillus macquariensis TaxID=948756 RepID=A0ABY1JP12_9BACL|nr:Cys-tRNA(Pro) deacylase [Paenibacillus macquariensis]MEC0092063.1 Cys-tRNA(Pro) deacylase [Paenibacillus macquariensis]OAB37370.1 aminoacyl-tRNA deacylase [Paenibacillus macquariensis subsp. macquariensis]SIQ51795.1 Cys-tRNA(Pro)/Cys-tRNA(Cys) deacylase [Paenibacillus macquariensis]
MSKTNAMRMLDKNRITYEIHEYDNEDGQIHGTAVADKINKPAETVFKTLVTHSKQNVFVFVIPVAEELDLKKAAKAAGEKKIEMLPMKELQKWTGYIRGGCSPVGMKKLFPTFIDQSAAHLEKMLVSAGKVGLQMELTPQHMKYIVSAAFIDLTIDDHA